MAITSALDVSEGASVADVGAGDGALLKSLAILVGKNGTIFGTEIDRKKLAKLRTLKDDWPGSGSLVLDHFAVKFLRN